MMMGPEGAQRRVTLDHGKIIARMKQMREVRKQGYVEMRDITNHCALLLERYPEDARAILPRLAKDFEEKRDTPTAKKIYRLLGMEADLRRVVLEDATSGIAESLEDLLVYAKYRAQHPYEVLEGCGATPVRDLRCWIRGQIQRTREAGIGDRELVAPVLARLVDEGFGPRLRSRLRCARGEDWQALLQVPRPDERFKYIHAIDVTGKHHLVAMRLAYHYDILKELKDVMHGLDGAREVLCFGGGFINLDRETGRILAYGRSEAFGEADHAMAEVRLEAAYQSRIDPHELEGITPEWLGGFLARSFHGDEPG